MLLSAGGTLAYQAVLWLRDGRWAAIPISTLDLPYPSFEWQGIQKVAVWLHDAPLSGWLFALAAGAIFVGTSLEQSGTLERRISRNRWQGNI